MCTCMREKVESGLSAQEDVFHVLTSQPCVTPYINAFLATYQILTRAKSKCGALQWKLKGRQFHPVPPLLAFPCTNGGFTEPTLPPPFSAFPESIKLITKPRSTVGYTDAQLYDYLHIYLQLPVLTAYFFTVLASFATPVQTFVLCSRFILRCFVFLVVQSSKA